MAVVRRSARNAARQKENGASAKASVSTEGIELKRSVEKSTKAARRVSKKKDTTTNEAKAPAQSAADVPNDGFWLIKAESETRLENGVDVKYSMDDMERDGIAEWDGIRNYQARNFLKAMKKGDHCLYYHSNTKKTRPGIVGLVTVIEEAYPDHTAFDKKAPYYDPKSDPADPRWFMVKLKFKNRFNRCITLDELKSTPSLAKMFLLTRARLSVSPVRKTEFDTILKMADQK